MNVKLMNVPEVAEFLHVSKATIYAKAKLWRLGKRGGLEYTMFASKMLFNEEHVMRDVGLSSIGDGGPELSEAELHRRYLAAEAKLDALLVS